MDTKRQIVVTLHTRKPHPIFKIVLLVRFEPDLHSEHAFKDFAVLHAELEPELKAKGVKMPAFPKRYTKSSLGLGLSTSELNDRTTVKALVSQRHRRFSSHVPSLHT